MDELPVALSDDSPIMSHADSIAAVGKERCEGGSQTLGGISALIGVSECALVKSTPVSRA